jgi:heme/copper-type cytochrome/quinol oxidase subunit 2
MAIEKIQENIEKIILDAEKHQELRATAGRRTRKPGSPIIVWTTITAVIILAMCVFGAPVYHTIKQFIDTVKASQQSKKVTVDSKEVGCKAKSFTALEFRNCMDDVEVKAEEAQDK